MPIKYAKKDWEIKTEQNLIYVAITRAKKTLNYIKEEKRVFGRNENVFDGKYMKSNIDAARAMIERSSSVGIREVVKHDNTIKEGLRKPAKLGERKSLSEQPINKKRKAADKFRKLL